MVFRRLAVLVGALLCLVGNAQAQQKHMLIYCGITMVKPITELARLFESRENVKIHISQGGSEDLFQSAKKSRLGDLYLPGSPSYLINHQPEGLFGTHKLVGYNQVALLVRKGNPKQVKSDLNELLRKDLTVIIGSPESASIGWQAKKMLEAIGIYAQVRKQSIVPMPDSRALNHALKHGEADVTLNWRATAFFQNNAALLDVIDLDPGIAVPRALYLIQLKFTRHPALSARFIDLAASVEGQAVFRKYGFIGNGS